MELMKHQRDLLDRLEKEDRSLYGKVLWGGVGSGKSITVLSYYLERDMVGDIYVITTAKKRDSLEWLRDAAKLGIGSVEGATVAGKITVDSWNNIKKYVDVKDAFFIFDEQRLIGSGAWVKSFYKIAKNNAWVVLSATPGDTWLDYIPVFVANGYYKNQTEFKREHVIYAPFSRYPKVLNYIHINKLEKLKQEVLVEMPYMSMSDRKHQDVQTFYDVEKFKTVSEKRWNVFEDKPIRNVSELFSVMRKVVYSDPSRLEALLELMEKHPKIIVFYNFNYELEALRTLTECADGFDIAEWNGHKKDPLPKSNRWVYLVQYAAGAEGWNCIETDTMVFYSLTYSYKQYEQAQGRIDRLNSPFSVLNYYSFMSNSLVDRAVRRSLDQKQSFNERKWADDFLPVFENYRDHYDEF
jgi:hypothetical protein